MLNANSPFASDRPGARVPRLSFAWMVCVLSILVLVSCGRPPDLIGIDNPDIPVNSVAEAKQHKIFIATTRQASEAVGAFYSEVRAPELGLASVEVSVPPTHVVGELERARRLPPDPRTEFAIIEPTVYAKDQAFISSINKELAKRAPGKRDVLFFVHGYNNTTSDALLRLAQFVEDSGFEGVPLLFDWASAAKLSRYVYDVNSALIARPKIADIGRILEQTNAEGYDVFAHSMGGFLIMEAMLDQSRRHKINASGRLNNIILASPDIDMDLFRSQLNQIDTDFRDIFVLISEDDSALRFSRRIAGGIPRVGSSDANELAELGVVAIDLSEIEDSRSGSHSKFAGSPEVVQLLGNGLNNVDGFNETGHRTVLGEALNGLPIKIVLE